MRRIQGDLCVGGAGFLGKVRFGCVKFELCIRHPCREIEEEGGHLSGVHRHSPG